eukprot:CAMPEP_0170523208 /NCGR_PEP_ID=MMETSP0209-20121228/8627_1 /TAXON_ID=665100 ORGANISM="Litonotus pictus, Strain P1" /NCGR_SAMPLE_ID=MMETSP0209 /ASSEMBLY_ACC=CAM_ASM_000301 /LENGTH=312 /DNA_ID=CAMNT_0010811167 /DNA_START=137 /DNA_END=1072 /DNA_ORIENTATION=+
MKCGSPDDSECFEGEADDDSVEITINGCESENQYCNPSSGSPTCVNKVPFNAGNLPDEFQGQLLPGETCEDDANCQEVTYYEGEEQKKIKKCTSGKCQGNKIGNKCYNDKSCEVGSSCENGTCTALIKQDQECERSIQCEPTTFCVTLPGSAKKTCAKAFTLPDYTALSSADVDKADLPFLCKSGFSYSSGSDNHICATRDYDSGVEVEDDGTVECDAGTQCKYQVTIGESSIISDSEDCTCPTFSSSGQGYCPYAQSNTIMKPMFDDISEKRKIYIGVGFHAEHRKLVGSPDTPAYNENCIVFYTTPLFKN